MNNRRKATRAFPAIVMNPTLDLLENKPRPVPYSKARIDHFPLFIHISSSCILRTTSIYELSSTNPRIRIRADFHVSSILIIKNHFLPAGTVSHQYSPDYKNVYTRISCDYNSIHLSFQAKIRPPQYVFPKPGKRLLRREIRFSFGRQIPCYTKRSVP